MGTTTAIVLLTTTFIFASIGMSGNLASLTGYCWWRNSLLFQQEDGLWKGCVSDHTGKVVCNTKQDIMNFYKNEESAIVMLLLIISCVFLCFSVLTTVKLFCCQQGKDSWACGASATSMFTFIGGFCGLGAMILAEISFREKFETNQRGWSNIFGWVGSSCGVISWVLSTLMMIVKPELGSVGKLIVHSPYNFYEPTNIVANRNHVTGSPYNFYDPTNIIADRNQVTGSTVNMGFEHDRYKHHM